jgi:hypothetical protein
VSRLHKETGVSREEIYNRHAALLLAADRLDDMAGDDESLIGVGPEVSGITHRTVSDLRLVANYLRTLAGHIAKSEAQ